LEKVIKKGGEMKNIVVYPGMFDPITFGHIDVIKRVHSLFGSLIVAVGENPDKHPLFSLDERIEMIKCAVKGMSDVHVQGFNGLVVDFARKNNARIIIRGLRMLSDFEYEFRMSLTNRNLAPDIETICIMPDEKYSHISSHLIKQVAFLGGDISKFVPSFIRKKLKQKFLRMGKCGVD
jgi:pantetheine-phosphate adenylyltransferase